eukprot:gene28200-31296_t
MLTHVDSLPHHHHSTPGQSFKEVYKVVMILDNRERFCERGNSGKGGRTESLHRHSQRIRERSKMTVDTRCLNIGDATWVARRHDNPAMEYMLEYIVERKSVADLAGSIKDFIYAKQKYRLQRCGLPRIMYLVEESARKRIKTATTTTLLDGFDVLHSANVNESIVLYASICRSIAKTYADRTHSAMDRGSEGQSPPQTAETFTAWNARIQSDNKSLTVREVFGLQLMTVAGVGETFVLPILQRYPTWHNLCQAFATVKDQARSTGADPIKDARQVVALLAK